MKKNPDDSSDNCPYLSSVKNGETPELDATVREKCPYLKKKGAPHDTNAGADSCPFLKKKKEEKAASDSGHNEL